MKKFRYVRMPDESLAILIDVKPLLDELFKYFRVRFPRHNEQFYRKLLHAVGYVACRVWQRAVNQANLDDYTKFLLRYCRYAVSYEREQVLMIPDYEGAKYFYFGTRPHPGRGIRAPCLRRKEKPWITQKDPKTGQPIGTHPGIDSRKVGIRPFVERELPKAVRRIVFKYYKDFFLRTLRSLPRKIRIMTEIAPQVSKLRIEVKRRERDIPVVGEKTGLSSEDVSGALAFAVPKKRLKKKPARRRVFGFSPKEYFERVQPQAIVEDWDLWCDTWRVWEELHKKRGKRK